MTGDFFQEAIKKYARQDLSGIDVSRRFGTTEDLLRVPIGAQVEVYR
jgi:hypothetical protein